MDSKMRGKVILTADDFGISEEANRNTLELVRLKKVDRASLLVDGILPREEIDALLSAGVKLDVHCNITEKFTGPRKMKEGIAKRSLLFLARYIGREISTSRVKQEWGQQIQKFKEIVGRYPDGINSHQHVHYYPRYFKAAIELAKHYSIPFIRCGRKGLLGKITGVKQILSIIRKTDVRYLQEIQTSDFMASLDWIKNVDEFLNTISEDSVEITFHPERKEEFELIKNI